MYKIPVFDENFILFATVAVITEIVPFFSFHSDYCKLNSFNIFMQLINPNCPSKNGVKQIKINKEKLSQSDIFYPNAEKPDANNRVKMQQKLLFTIKLTFTI